MTTLRSALSYLTEAILDEVFPPECVRCTQEGPWLCQACLKDAIEIQTPTCPFCDKLSPLGKTCARCMNHSQLFGCRSIWYYKPPIPTLIHRYKYGGIKASVRFLLPYLINVYQELPLGTRAEIIITSVPSSRQRIKKYGYNQSEIMANALAHELGIEYRPLLRRHNKSQSQTKLGRQARLTNAMGQFYPFGDAKIEGATLIVVDDVLTTGATLTAVAAELKKMGAKRVWGLTLAKD